MKVAYARVSSDPDGSSVSPEAQLAECIEEARRRGWDPAELRELIDRDLSAWKRTVNRPAWSELVEGISGGLIDGVIVHHLDRLLRQVRDLEALIEAIEQRGGRFPIYSVHGDLDLSTPDGRAMARILVTIAQKESDDKSRRLQLVLGAKAREGRSHGGTRPYGYDPADRRRTLPFERATVLQLVEWLLEGRSLSSMARDLNAAEVPPPSGKGLWHHQVIRRILLSPRYAGLRTHKSKVVAEGDWEAIIDVDTHTQILQLLDRPSGRSSARRWWGSTNMVCGRCGHKMLSTPHSSGRRYTCLTRDGGCGGNGILAEPTDVILETITLHLLAAEWDDAPITPKLDTGALEDAERRLSELARDYYVDRTIDRIQFEAVNAELTAEVERLRDAAIPGPKRRISLADAWATATPVERANTLDQVIGRVTIHPSAKGFKRYDPTRIEIQLRGSGARPSPGRPS